MTRTPLIGIAALATLLAGPARAQVMVDNAELWFEGGRTVASFNVANEGTTAAQFTLQTGDWDRLDDGTNRFFAPGTTPSSCERALEVFPRQLRIAPGGSQTVRVTLKSDSLPSRACWSIIFVQPEAPPTTGARTSVAYITRIGVKVYYLPAQTVNLVELQGFVQTTPQAPGDSAAIAATFENKGTRPASISGTVEIRRADNFTVANVAVGPVPILPGASRVIRIPLPAGVLPGTYVALGVFDYGADEDLAAQAPVQVR